MLEPRHAAEVLQVPAAGRCTHMDSMLGGTKCAPHFTSHAGASAPPAPGRLHTFMPIQ